jgi:GNAT superfamily N-acetyltransferase
VATSKPARRCGYASALITDVMELLRGEGVNAFFLHSDVDPRIYARLGFASLRETGPGQQGCVCMAQADAVLMREFKSPTFGMPRYF